MDEEDSWWRKDPGMNLVRSVCGQSTIGKPIDDAMKKLRSQVGGVKLEGQTIVYERTITSSHLCWKLWSRMKSQEKCGDPLIRPTFQRLLGYAAYLQNAPSIETSGIPTFRRSQKVQDMIV